MSSVNKVILVCNLASDVDTRSLQSGGKVCNFRVATNERWTDKQSGEKKDRAQFHNIVIWNENLVTVAEKYLKKGSKVYLEGQLETRSYDDKKSGEKKYVTEVVLRPFRGELVLLDSKGNDTKHGEGAYAPLDNAGSSGRSAKPAQGFDDMSDEIPFMSIGGIA